jgi:hypothetical protein
MIDHSASLKRAISKLPPFESFAHGPQTDAVSQRHGLAGLMLLDHPPHQFRSTVRRQTRILMNVHSVPLEKMKSEQPSASQVGTEWTTS